MEEKMTNKDLESQLQPLRSKATIAKVLTSCSGAAMMLCFITGLVSVAIFFIVLEGGGGFQMEKSNNKLKKLLSNDAVSGALKETLGGTVEYNPWGKINLDSMVFPFTYNCTGGSDHIRAVYHRPKIELGDIKLINESGFADENAHTEKQSITLFKGQWFTCDFGKELAGEVYISEWTKKSQKPEKQCRHG